MKMTKTSRRTVMLAFLAAGSFVYSAIVHFDVDPQLMLRVFILSVVLLLAAVAVGALGALLLTWFRKRGDS